MKTLYFLTGSQPLYGEDVLNAVEKNAKSITEFFSKTLTDTIKVVSTPTIINAEVAVANVQKANADPDCAGVIAWMHTFSPAKMWISALKYLQKPLLHLHTQMNEYLPYDKIDMDFMNLNQSAHGDREFGFICTRLGIKREIVAGFYKDETVINRIKKFAEVAKAINYSSTLRVAVFGNNMRNVAVTDGDRVESEIRYGWNVNYYAIGDVIEVINSLTTKEINDKMAEYADKYDFNPADKNAITEQAKYEVGFKKFLKSEGIDAFADTFQNLYGLKQLLGLAAQNLMADGVGFGAEGDYKTAAMMAIMCKIAEGRDGATAFMEDYTYDLDPTGKKVLGSHMLEVSPVFASTKPKIEVHPLGIGGKEPPARLVFDGIQGDAISVSMIDMGNRYRLICAKIKLIKQPKAMPNLPVARLMWTLEPNFEVGSAAWIYAGGAHHTVVSTALTVEDMRLFAKLTDTEFVVIDENTNIDTFQEKLGLQ